MLILSRFTPEVFYNRPLIGFIVFSHFPTMSLIYILADYWNRTNQAPFVYRRHFNTLVT